MKMVINFFKIIYLVKTLEMLINEIKLRGFEKFRHEIDERINIKKHFELSVESLQKKVNFFNSQKKHYGTKNTKMIGEIFQFRQCSEVNKYFYSQFFNFFCRGNKEICFL
jgi:hypothetical protein